MIQSHFSIMQFNLTKGIDSDATLIQHSLFISNLLYLFTCKFHIFTSDMKCNQNVGKMILNICTSHMDIVSQSFQFYRPFSFILLDSNQQEGEVHAESLYRFNFQLQRSQNLLRTWGVRNISLLTKRQPTVVTFLSLILSGDVKASW